MAHAYVGTGTAIGDPIEAEAIGSVFRTIRSTDDPLYLYGSTLALWASILTDSSR